MNMEKPKVSVVVPIYNVEAYLNECLDSLLAQQMDGLEVILVNDGSKDSSGEIAKAYAEKYPDLFFYYEEENSGLSAARNFGVTKAHGEYISFVDSDDYTAPGIYQKMYDAGKRDDSDMVCCGYDRIDAETRKPIFKYRFHTMYRSGHSVAEYPGILTDVSCFAWNKLYRPYLLTALPFPKGQKYEDSAVTYSMAEMANRVSFVNEAGVYYRDQRAGSISAEPGSYFDIFKSMSSMYRYYSEKGLAKEYKAELEYLAYRHLLSHTRSVQLMNGKKSVAWKYICKSFNHLRKYYPGWKQNAYLRTDSPWNTPKYELRRVCLSNRFMFFGRIVLGSLLKKKKDRKTAANYWKLYRRWKHLVYNPEHTRLFPAEFWYQASKSG